MQAGKTQEIIIIFTYPASAALQSWRHVKALAAIYRRHVRPAAKFGGAETANGHAFGSEAVLVHIHAHGGHAGNAEVPSPPKCS